MRITDLPSLGPHSRSHHIRRDVAQVLSQISTAASRGADPSTHVKAFREFLGACAKELKAIEKIEASPLYAVVPDAVEPEDKQLSLDDI
jgi:hypothetical protein